MRRRGLIFDVAAALFGGPIGIAVGQDHRANIAQRVLLFIAAGAIGIPLLRHRTEERIVAVTVSSIAAIAAYPIGGLAMLLPAALILGGMAVDGIVGRSRRNAARTLVWLFAILVPLSLFDPGGAVFVIVPLAIPCMIWGIRNYNAESKAEVPAVQ